MEDNIRRFFHKPVKSTFQDIIYFTRDALDSLLGRRDALTPPIRLRNRVGAFTDPRLYRKVGEDFLRHFKDLCSLEPDEDVLDVGCGCGQVAVPLAKYLNERATYQGFDVVPTLVEWCRRNISSKYPNFQFRLANVFNKMYNPCGQYQASEYKFLYRNEFFDFIFAKSVFTHMLPKDMENYLSEIARVLKKGGRCLITFFLWNEESSQSVNAGRSTLDFRHGFGRYHTVDSSIPETAVSYDERFVLSLYESYGLKIKRPISFGSWCGRSSFLSYQDIIIASKE